MKRIWWKPWTWSGDAEIKLEAQPVQLNPNKERQLARAVGRLQRVKAAIAKGDQRPELQAEAKKLQQFIDWAS